MMKNLLTFLFVFLALASVTATAAEITGVSIADQSTYYGSASPVNLINGSGVNPNGDGTHSDVYTDMWMSSGTYIAGQYVTFDLGGLYTLDATDTVKIWNWNQAGTTGRGVQSYYVYTSATSSFTGGTYETFGPFALSEGPGDTTTAYAETEDISPSGDLRYVKVEVISSYGYDAFVGLSEIRFYGSSSNTAPTVDVGSDFGAQVGVGSAIDATVTDDGNPDPPGTVTYQWSVTSGDANYVSFSPSATVEDVTVTITLAGDYALQLEASDSALSASDTVNVKVLPADYNEILGVSLEDVTSFYPGFPATNLIGNVGLTWDGSYGTHSISVGMWAANNTPTDDVNIIYDLGAVYDLDYVQIWNANNSLATTRGLKNFNVLTSLNGDSYSSVGSYLLQAGPMDDTYDFSEVFTASATGVRFVMIDCVDDYSGSSGYVTLSEIKFSGDLVSYVPEVEAGPKTRANLGGGGTVDITMQGDVNDIDSSPTILWTVASGDANYVSFTDDTDPTTSVTFSATGEYILQLTANDGGAIVSDTVEIDIYPNGYTGLIGQWKMDGDATDSSANANDANVVGNPQWQTSGQCSYGSIAFDGSNDWLDVPNESLYDVEDEVTIAFWMKADAWTNAYECIFMKDIAFLVRRNAATNVLQCYMNTVGNVVGTTPVADDQWHHVAVSYDGTAIRLYVDAVEENYDLVPDRPIQLNDSIVTIARDSSASGREYGGELQDVRIYEIGLTAAEVLDVYLECGVACEGGFMLGDINEDCKVNFEDFADMATNWLGCNDFNPANCP